MVHAPSVLQSTQVAVAAPPVVVAAAVVVVVAVALVTSASELADRQRCPFAVAPHVCAQDVRFVPATEVAAVVVAAAAVVVARVTVHDSLGSVNVIRRCSPEARMTNILALLRSRSAIGCPARLLSTCCE